MKTIEQKLDKTATTISNHVARGNNLYTNSRSEELQARYDELMEQAKDTSKWVGYCEKHHYAVNHQAFDFWA